MARKPARRLPPAYTTRAAAGLGPKEGDQETVTLAEALAPPPMGDNHPPPDGPPVFDAADIEAGLRARTAECSAAALNVQMLACDLPESMPADDGLDAALDQLATFEVEARKADKLIDTARTVEKEPYLAGTRIVDGYFRPWRTSIEAKRKAAKSLKDKIAYRVSDLARQQAAAAAEQARKLAEEKRVEAQALADRGLNHVADTVAQDAAKIEKAADRGERLAEGPIRTASGVSVAITAVWTGTITDYAALRAASGPLGLYLTDVVLEAAVRAAVKAGARVLPGVKISEYQSSGAR